MQEPVIEFVDPW